MKTTDNQPKNASEPARHESITSAERDAKREACLDDIVKSQARIVDLLAASAARDAKQDAQLDSINEKLVNIEKSVEALKGALTPWKIVLGGIVSIAFATVLSVLGVKGINALLELLK